MALIAALVFALHLAQTEAVTYISSRSTSLMATFYLAAFLVWLHGNETGRENWRRIAAPVLFVAALAVKKTAWTLRLPQRDCVVDGRAAFTAQACRLSGDFPCAKAAYERALELDPDYIQARINLRLLPMVAQ